MLKEVGASGQISLGKKYAGQLFDMVFAPDGRVELVPMKAVPTVQTELSTDAPEAHRVQEEMATYRVGDGWLTSERAALRKAAAERSPEELEAFRSRWEAENKDAIAAMNKRVSKISSMGLRLHERRTAKAQQHPESTEKWAENHAVEIDQYNAWASQREPYSQRVRRWRESVAPQTDEKTDAGKQ